METHVVFLKETELFLDNLDDKARRKIFSDIRKTKIGLRGQWFRKMPGTDDIWELRTLFNKTYYRIFGFWHRIYGQETILVFTNGFIKKSDKTPLGEIEKAERIKREFKIGRK